MILVFLKSLEKEGTSMAGSDQSKKSSRQNDRLGPSIAQGSSSRVSNVVGSMGSQSTRGGQSANKQGSLPQQQSSQRRRGNKRGNRNRRLQADREENRHRVLIDLPISLLPLPVVLQTRELSLKCVMLGALCSHITSSDFWG